VTLRGHTAAAVEDLSDGGGGEDDVTLRGHTAAAVEDLSDGGGGEDAVAAQKVGDVATDRHDNRHDEVRQRRQRPALSQHCTHSQWLNYSATDGGSLQARGF